MSNPSEKKKTLDPTLSIKEKQWNLNIMNLWIMKSSIDLVVVFDAIFTSTQTCEKLQCLNENLMSHNFRKTAVLKKISIVN